MAHQARKKSKSVSSSLSPFKSPTAATRRKLIRQLRDYAQACRDLHKAELAIQLLDYHEAVQGCADRALARAAAWTEMHKLKLDL